MGVERYRSRGKVFWKIDERFQLPDGSEQRLRMRRVPTREQALALVAKRRSEAFEGRFFERKRPVNATVAELWEAYRPVSERDNDSWQTDTGRAAHLLRHLGDRPARGLTQAEVDGYRNARLGEKTRRGRAPAPATLDREVELLKRVLSYGVACGKLDGNPLAKVGLLRQPNVRREVLSERDFRRLHDAAEEELRPILVVAFDTGMRKGEILGLRWTQVDLAERAVRLAPQDTKTEAGRTVYLTERAVVALRGLPGRLGGKGEHVFVNPETGKAWRDLRKAFARARAAAGLPEIWFHDLRRSFVTNARRRGVAESVVMRMSGHRTRAVFDRYNVVSDDDVRAAVTRIEAGTLVEAAPAPCERRPDRVPAAAGESGQELVKVPETTPSGTTKAPENLQGLRGLT